MGVPTLQSKPLGQSTLSLEFRASQGQYLLASQSVQAPNAFSSAYLPIGHLMAVIVPVLLQS